MRVNTDPETDLGDICCVFSWIHVRSSLPIFLCQLVLVSAQVLVILGQDWFGLSFFLPKSVCLYDFSPHRVAHIMCLVGGTVKVYDYRPPMLTGDTEVPKQPLGDCTICMEPIVVHPESTLSVTKGTSAPLITSTSTGI